MMRTRFHELGQFFGCYLHQDWDLEASDWRAAVQNYLDHEPLDCVMAATSQLEVLLSLDLDDAHLDKALAELGNAYSPRPHQTDRAWLIELHGILREAVARARPRSDGK